MCMYVTKINSFIFKLYTYINWYIHPYNIVINQYFFSPFDEFSLAYTFSPLSHQGCTLWYKNQQMSCRVDSISCLLLNELIVQSYDFIANVQQEQVVGY